MKELGYGKREEGVPREVCHVNSNADFKFMPSELRGMKFFEWNGRGR